MKVTKLMFTILLVAAIFIIPVTAAPGGGGGGGGGDDDDGIQVDVNNEFDPTFSPEFSPDVDNYNYNNNNNWNFNTNNNRNYNDNHNYNFNIVDVDQEQKQKQQQQQQQQQKQKQDQEQSQYQIVTVPTDSNGILVSGVSNQPPKVAQLDVGEAKVVSRLVYPGEVLPFEVTGGDKITVRAASDIGFYTIGVSHNDIWRISSSESIPVYDPVYHRFDFGIVVPVDRVDYWTTKAALTASSGATYVVVDNRAPHNGYTHIELTIEDRSPPEETPRVNITELYKSVQKPDVFPVDDLGRAITS